MADCNSYYISKLCIAMLVICLANYHVNARSASEDIAKANENVDFRDTLENLKNDKKLIKSLDVLKNVVFADTDELLTKEQVESNHHRNATGKRRRRAILQKKLKRQWENNTVPYVLDPESGYTQKQINLIKNMMRAIEYRSCIKFKQYIFPNLPKNPFVIIASKSGCWSTVGRNIVNVISLNATSCMVEGIILHEYLHVLGFRHEQSRADRDKYIKVNWKNIREGKKGDFKKRADTESLGQHYDVSSIMHYHETAFSKDGKPTLEVLRKHKYMKKMGGAWLSRSDIIQLNLLYNCRPKRFCRWGYRARDC